MVICNLFDREGKSGMVHLSGGINEPVTSIFVEYPSPESNQQYVKGPQIVYAIILAIGNDVPEITAGYYVFSEFGNCHTSTFPITNQWIVSLDQRIFPFDFNIRLRKCRKCYILYTAQQLVKNLSS